MSWQQAWREGRTPWDAGQSPPILTELVQRDELPRGRVLVPGCGSGYDVLTLASGPREVTGLEIAPEALQRFESLRQQAGVSPEQASVRQEDFFSWQPPHRFDLIWDYTFLCALHPQDRGSWLSRVDELLAPDGELITLIFPIVDRPADDGPPYPLHPEQVRALVSPRFEPHVLEPVERSHPSRQGMEWLGRWHRHG
jgi:hypothetical protein